MQTTIKVFFLLFIVSPCISQIDWEKYEAISMVSDNSPVKLAKTITASFDTQEEKAEAIYYWVTHNISYDYKLYEKMKKSKGNKKKYSKKELEQKERKEIAKTLKSKKGICQQYSNVFKALCEAVGIQCILVSGYAKANPMRSGLGEKHAWNAVYLNDNWHLIDATFGAGYVNDDKKFTYSFDGGYFKSDPNAFKMNHLPTQSKWQLSEELMSKDDYKNNPGVGSGYFKYEISGLSPATYKISATKTEPLVIRFSSVKDLEELNIVNLRKLKEVTGEVLKEVSQYTITLDTAELKPGVYGVYSGQKLLFSHRISVN